MGGGAGIEIVVELEQFYVTRSKNNKRKFLVLQQPVISKWSAVGYMDGQRNLNGDLLKTQVIIHDIDPQDADWLHKQGVRPGDRLAAWVEEHNWPKDMLWAGWCRGKWQDAFPRHMEFEIYVEVFGYIKATLMIEPADKVRFNSFWEDTFNFIFTEENLVEGDRCLEDVYELHHENCVANYGA
jgi:hypothetical protein